MQTLTPAVGHIVMAIGLACVTSHCAPDGPAVVVHTARGPVRVAVELARTDTEQQRGLMYREHLGDGQGMLFLFDQLTEHPFWMKNTLIPLDMIHIDATRRIVGIVADATPLSTQSLSIGKPSTMVLEVRGGYARETGMEVGNTVDLVAIAP